MIDKNIISTSITKTGKTITFRYPTIEDTQILLNFINKVSLEKVHITLQGEQKTFEEEEAWLKTVLKNIEDKKIVMIFTFIENKLAGLSDIVSGSYIKKYIGGFGIIIDSDFRGEGIGKQIMNVVIDQAVKNIANLKIIKLEVFAQNLIARELYKKMGFIEYGLLPKSIFYKNEFVDEVLMYKEVSNKSNEI